MHRSAIRTSVAVLCLFGLSRTGAVAQEEAPRKVVVFHLRSVPASDAAKAIQGILGDETDVRLVAEPVSNSLVASGPEKLLETIEALVQRLDRARAVLSIEIVVAELSGDAAVEAGGDLSEWIEKQRAAKRLLNVERARMTTLEGQPAMLQVGEERGVRSGSSFNGRGRITQYTMRNTGTVIELNPRVSGDDVLVETRVERSALGEELSVDAAPDDEAPPTGTSVLTLQSTVRIPLGKPVLIGSKSKDGRLHVVIVRVETID